MFTKVEYAPAISETDKSNVPKQMEGTASISDFTPIYLESEKGLDARVFSTRQIGGFSTEQGDLESTESPLDVAIRGEGYFIIQPFNGDIALSRRGDLKIDPDNRPESLSLRDFLKITTYLLKRKNG